MLTDTQVKEIQKIRQTLHKYPELSGTETDTASFVKGYLDRFGADDIVTGIGGDGLLGIFNGANPDSGQTLMIRAELDALAIHEQSDIEYKSGNDGVMHACGHDGHMAIVLGVGKWLKENRPDRGRVILLFQPAEETGLGAGEMLKDKALKNLKIDRGIALHNLPGYKKNTVYIKDNTFASASVGMKIQFQGQSSHAAYPREGINPALSISELVQNLERVKKQALQHDKFRVLTVTYIKLGEPAFGINPGRGEMGVTVRAETDEGISEMIGHVKHELSSVKKMFKGTISIEQREPFSAVINDAEGVNKLTSITKSLDIETQILNDPFAWSEDFGEFRKKCPITLFGLGAGENSPALHSEIYNFDDDLIPVGTSIFCECINRINNG
ncbi:amidohydrolase [Rhodohalobacter sp. 8-1]|uniref:amidohydrolase n=1 Tax=Rhodohalobacter sp. 8-1 TaxID=3131972 RepID=UPI0030EC080C